MLLHGVRVSIFAIGFLNLCIAQSLPCTVTQNGGQTLYSVPEFTGTGCNIEWTDADDYVLANHGPNVDGKVVVKTNRTLLTKECINQTYYIRDCISEGMQYKAICITNCSENARPAIGEESSHSWIIAPVVLLLLLLLLLLGFLCYWYRKRIARRLSCFYTSVKTQDVEAQRR